MNFRQPEKWSENELIARCRKNDRVAQKALYDRFSRKMYAVSLRYMEDRERAKDILQDGFVKAFSHLASYSGEGSFEGWLRKIFANTALEELRKNNVLKNHVDLADPVVAIEAASVDLDHFTIEEIHHTIAGLPVGFRTVFNMYAIEGYSHHEIADTLNIEESTSRSQFLRAKAMLRDRLSKIGITE